MGYLVLPTLLLILLPPPGLRLGSATQSFSRAEVASAERPKDGRIDGALKGALVGIMLTAIGNSASREYGGRPSPETQSALIHPR